MKKEIKCPICGSKRFYLIRSKVYFDKLDVEKMIRVLDNRGSDVELDRVECENGHEIRDKELVKIIEDLFGEAEDVEDIDM